MNSSEPTSASIRSAENAFESSSGLGLEPSQNSSEESSLKFPGTEEGDSQLYGSFEGFDQYITRRRPLIEAPKITTPMFWAKLRWGFFTTYRRLFALVFMGNMGAFIYVLAERRNPNRIANAVAANLAATGLIRLPQLVNIFYLTMCSLPHSWPLLLRRAAADVSHFGGVHSGCGFAALCWYIGLCGVVTRDYVTRSPPEIHSAEILGLMYSILVVIMAIVISAYPAFRFKSHDTFEFTHRFSGWTLVALFWAFILVFADKQAKAEHTSIGHELVRFPSFWFAVMLTLAFGIPWVTLRKVPVDPDVLSNHAVRLHFSHTTTGFAQGIGVSHHPLRDWHNFAGIPNVDGKPGFSVIVSRVGDFTGGAIERPPWQLWKRGIPASGFGHAILLFKRVLLITTGSGMGPCLSLLASDKRPPTRIFWQTRSPFKTYGPAVLDLISRIDEKAVVVDSDRHGRKDMFPAAWDMAVDFQAEAVFVVSRPWVVRSLIFQFEARGVPAFGPIFDQ